MDSEEDVVRIKKTCYPNDEDIYYESGINHVYCMYVEIMCKDNYVPSIKIVENVGDGLEITNCTKYYRISGRSIDELIEYKEGKLYENASNLTNMSHDIEKISNKSLYIEENNFRPSDRIVYRYYFKPNWAGSHETYTIVRTEYHSDLDYPSIVNVKECVPELSIDVISDKIEASFGERINISYVIKYGGGTSNPYTMHNIQLDSENKNRFLYQGDTARHNITLTKSNNIYKLDNISIKCKNGNLFKNYLWPRHEVYTLPGIMVDGRYYPNTDLRVTVDTWIYKYRDIVALMVSFAALTSMIYYNTKKEMKRLDRSIKSGYNPHVQRFSVRRRKKGTKSKLKKLYCSWLMVLKRFYG